LIDLIHPQISAMIFIRNEKRAWFCSWSRAHTHIVILSSRIALLQVVLTKYKGFVSVIHLCDINIMCAWFTGIMQHALTCQLVNVSYACDE
jgi:hypothetical protein